MRKDKKHVVVFLQQHRTSLKQYAGLVPPLMAVIVGKVLKVSYVASVHAG